MRLNYLDYGYTIWNAAKLFGLRLNYLDYGYTIYTWFSAPTRVLRFSVLLAL